MASKGEAKVLFKDGILSVWEEGPGGETVRSYAGTPSELLDLVGGATPQNVTARYTTARTAMTFGCATLGYVGREDCRDEHEERRRLEELAASKGYEVLSWEGDVAVVRLPR